MKGYLCLILHAHLPFVRHPEHERFLEESWLFEATTETYLPLIQCLQAWQRDRLDVQLTLTLSPTLCSMLHDPLLQSRYRKRLDALIRLADQEVQRTHWQPEFQTLAEFYLERLTSLCSTYDQLQGDLISAFRAFQDEGYLEIITCSATHAVLPLLHGDAGSLRGQILTATEHYASCFGRSPKGIWLPECAYSSDLDPFLIEAGLRWFPAESHALLYATPRPHRGVYAPLLTPSGLAAFGRDPESAQQVWSRESGYPGDPYYRDFYRDIGFDLDFDYVSPFLPSPDHRGFTSIKYHRITGGDGEKRPYLRPAALERAEEHARHFVERLEKRTLNLASRLGAPPLIVAPFDAELFGHWWYEGIDFLDQVVRHLHRLRSQIRAVSPLQFLSKHPNQQVSQPAASSWGEGGYWHVWLDETNEWIHPLLLAAQHRMHNVVRNQDNPSPLTLRALNQAARELLLAQSSDWPFIIRAGSHSDYARSRIENHLRHFHALCDQVRNQQIHRPQLEQLEQTNGLFPGIDHQHWN